MREEEFNAIVKYASQMAKHETAVVAYRRAHATIKGQLLHEAHVHASYTKTQLQQALYDTTQSCSHLANVFGLKSYVFLWTYPYSEYSRHTEALNRIWEIEASMPEYEFTPDEGNWEKVSESTYANVHLELSLNCAKTLPV